MTVSVDPQIAAGLAALAAQRAASGFTPARDVLGLRAQTNAGLTQAFSRLPAAPDVTSLDCSTRAVDGVEVAMRWYARRGSETAAAVVYAHGGGMVCGSVDAYDPLVRHYVQLTGTPFLAVEYRLAPEFASAGLGRDVVAALRWLNVEAGRLGVDPGRIALMGDSGGGGVAASAAIQARDAGLAVARQILIYPMLDDRNTVADPTLTTNAVWTYESNAMAWDAIAGQGARDGVAPYLAPARLSDFRGLAPAYIEVGELDIFRDECVAYAQKLYAAGISCELHVHPGAPHGYEIMSVEFELCRRAMADRARVIAAL